MRYLIVFFLFFSCDNYFKKNSTIDIARVDDDKNYIELNAQKM